MRVVFLGRQCDWCVVDWRITPVRGIEKEINAWVRLPLTDTTTSELRKSPPMYAVFCSVHTLNIVSISVWLKYWGLAARGVCRLDRAWRQIKHSRAVAERRIVVAFWSAETTSHDNWSSGCCVFDVAQPRCTWVTAALQILFPDFGQVVRHSDAAGG